MNFMVEKVVATFIFVCQPYICLLERETNYPSAQYIESKLTLQRKCFLAACELLMEILGCILLGI